jgi:hypothetical protein
LYAKDGSIQRLTSAPSIDVLSASERDIAAGLGLTPASVETAVQSEPLRPIPSSQFTVRQPETVGDSSVKAPQPISYEKAK